MMIDELNRKNNSIQFLCKFIYLFLINSRSVFICNYVKKQQKQIIDMLHMYCCVCVDI